MAAKCPAKVKKLPVGNAKKPSLEGSIGQVRWQWASLNNPKPHHPGNLCLFSCQLQTLWIQPLRLNGTFPNMKWHCLCW